MSSKNVPELAPPGSLRPWSLAARLTAWYAGSAFALILAATGFLYWALLASLDREDDEFLANKVQVLRTLLQDRPADTRELEWEVKWERITGQYIQVYVRILDGSGKVLAETPGMSESLPTAWFPRPFPADEQAGRGVEVSTQGGKSFRIVAACANGGAPEHSSRVLQVALDRTHEKDIVASYRGYLWLVLAVALIVCSLGGYWIARRGIRPVKEITRTARRIRSTTLHERIGPAGLPAELSTLAETFNEMLDRLEESFDRLARFSADIAHELRTPLSNLRGEAEVALSKPRPPEEYRNVLGSALEEYARLSRMIDSLLFLARAENPKAQITRERLNVRRELAAVTEFYEAAAAEAGVTLRVVAEVELEACLDRTLVQRAVGNLVENAIMHNGPGGTVTVTAIKENGTVRLEVMDTGCGIPTNHLPHIFDRFYRVDRARSKNEGGVGLGLAIVKSIATLHGGSVHIESEVGQGTRVTLVFSIDKRASNCIRGGNHIEDLHRPA